MQYLYPCVLTPEAKGGYAVSFPDVAGALTCGDDRAEALAMAEDALLAALAGYVREQWDIPVPSTAGHGQELVAVPPIAAAKLALYTAMRRQHITTGELAVRLGLDEPAVRRLVDLDHRSPLGHVERALRAVGRFLVVGDRSRTRDVSAQASELRRESPGPRTTPTGGWTSGVRGAPDRTGRSSRFG